MEFTGRHVFGSLTHISDVEFLSDITRIRATLERGILCSGATLLSWQSHGFEPHGCTVIGLLSESHVSVHTYPEESSLFFDAFTCGDTCDPLAIFQVLKGEVGACLYTVEQFRRSARRAQRLSYHESPIEISPVMPRPLVRPSELPR